MIFKKPVVVNVDFGPKLVCVISMNLSKGFQVKCKKFKFQLNLIQCRNRFESMPHHVERLSMTP